MDPKKRSLCYPNKETHSPSVPDSADRTMRLIPAEDENALAEQFLSYKLALYTVHCAIKQVCNTTPHGTARQELEEQLNLISKTIFYLDVKAIERFQHHLTAYSDFPTLQARIAHASPEAFSSYLADATELVKEGGSFFSSLSKDEGEAAQALSQTTPFHESVLSDVSTLLSDSSTQPSTEISLHDLDESFLYDLDEFYPPNTPKIQLSPLQSCKPKTPPLHKK